MEVFLILFALLLLGVGFVIPIIALFRANKALREAEFLRTRLNAMENRLEKIQKSGLAPLPAREKLPEPPADKPRVEPSLNPPPSPKISPGVMSETPPVLPIPTELPPHIPSSWMPQETTPPSPEKPPADPPKGAAKLTLAKVKDGLNWEQFMGAKLYAWIGGITLFLAAAYFVKYSFDQGWMPPEVRVGLGFLLGIGLVVGGTRVRREAYKILSHTLCATGVLVLYGVTFACRAVYHFEFFGPVAAFALMALITAAAFVLAVSLEALPVVVLGMLGGFLTPLLLSTGQDAPLALFGYIALLDAGVAAVALRKRWFFLTPFAAAGTAMMEIGWSQRFFEAGQYDQGSLTLIPMGVTLGFCGMWIAATALARRRDATDRWTSGGAAGLLAVATMFVFRWIYFPGIAERPWLFFGFVFLLNAVALVLSRLDPGLRAVYPIAGAAVFGAMTAWLARGISPPLLPAALAFTLLFALAHTLVPLAFRRRDGKEGATEDVLAIGPLLALVALLIPVFKLTELSFWIWPVILLVNALAVTMAAVTGFVLPVVAMLALTLVAAGGMLFKRPAEAIHLPSLLAILGVAAVFFAAAGIGLSRRRAAAGQAGSGSGAKNPGETLAAQLPAFAAVLPFVLLIMIVVRLPMPSPSPVFGLALLLVAMLLAVTRIFGWAWLPVIGLACVAALECVWQFSRFQQDAALTALTWYLLFFALFAIFPFAMRSQFSNVQGPWIASALSGPIQFFLIHRLVSEAWPNRMMGLLAAVFALPALAGLMIVLKSAVHEGGAKQTRLALFGGVALFFITLIFPLQFDRQWITVSWALEGMALCALFHRVPHPGLRLTGTGLLLVSFARLALNPAVLRYHERSETPILNWYLYTYGVVALALFVAARMLAPPRDRVLGCGAPGILNAMGAVLAFLLLNIQIADFFTEPGAAALTFKFSGNFARDMSYSIGWALFALLLLVAGIARKIPLARYAALALLGVTVLKLFLHDLARLAAPYRIGALVAVALVALAASFLYQKFIPRPGLSNERESTPMPPP